MAVFFMSKASLARLSVALPSAGTQSDRLSSLPQKSRLVVTGGPRGKDVLVGCIDVASNVVETPQDVAETIRAALDHVPPERLCPCINWGMAPMAADIAYAKLASLAAGAELAWKAV
jgi:methionine synthase II (cobalamin-independent)